MWLSVLVPEKGLTRIELANDDPTVSHVKTYLGSILHRDTAMYDLFLDGLLLEDSAMLSDFDLTDSSSYVTLVDRTSALAFPCASRKYTSQCDPCEQSVLYSSQTDVVTSTPPRRSASPADPIEQFSPSMSELDPIESTPREHSKKSTPKPSARQRVKRKAAMESKEAGNERFGFPKWQCQRHHLEG